MTSTPFTSDVHGTDDHPEVAEISALTEDLLSPERAAAVHAHLSACELCADVRTSLDEIRDTLGTLPGPARMPEDIAGRLDAALAAEALLDASPSGSGHVSRETEAFAGSAAPRAGAASVSRETALTRKGPSTRPAGHPGGASRPGRHRPTRRTRRWRSAVLAGAGAVVALSIGGVVWQSLDSSAPPTAADASEEGRQGAADGGLEKQVHTLLAQQHSAEKSRGSKTPDLKSKQSPGDSPLAGPATSVPSCIKEGVNRTEAPLAVDASAEHDGEKGYLVVLPHRGDSERVDAYLVDAACVTGEKTGPADVLTKGTYQRR
ncbi:hypothetical protein GCM10012287_25590 [Streptomyces daqingensis]|uniref:Zinc-finger domain-containing protein n=1 Tax=Streptomyces daqingensis TaxID=1472640 RepID=A0ABQ2MAV5_9ACTN|nr:hypothetical protein [Streptomyces daqingensis]GGO49081.1 hypothetical protein GCM10012287_25590 [Streptomyces daqingensis]